jgi:hypothetical protein
MKHLILPLLLCCAAPLLRAEIAITPQAGCLCAGAPRQAFAVEASGTAGPFTFRPCQGCMFDLEMFLSVSNSIKLIEYKSVQNAAGIPLPQFTNYMFNISQISEMRYIFNAEKISLEQAKQGMQSFFNTNKMQVFEVIWGNQPLRSHLFPGSSETAALSSFSGLIDDTDSILYSFIMIY